MPPSPQRLTERLKAEARNLGFDLIGAAPAVEASGASHLADWIEAGYAGQMHYIPERREAYRHPSSILSGARSLLMLGRNYRTCEPRAATSGTGRVSRYAWGRDYHDRIHEDLKRLSAVLRAEVPDAMARGVVDTAPLLEREFAELAGLGWIGKNTLLLNREAGSWFFLAALLTDAELDYEQTQETDHCGTCTACLDACPTDAFPQPYVLDSRRCISYLTIELRSSIPEELRPGIGQWVFGCDICQDVCPWNQRAPVTSQEDFEPRHATNPLPLLELFDLDEQAFGARFRTSPLWRARRRGLLRNAAIALGNHPADGGIAALEKGLHDSEPLVRGAAAWALGRYPASESVPLLRGRLEVEREEEVRGEITAALEAGAN
jgi:epoxyqueuosine reductase